MNTGETCFLESSRSGEDSDNAEDDEGEVGPVPLSRCAAFPLYYSYTAILILRQLPTAFQVAQ
jgi:hypothetical protein